MLTFQGASQTRDTILLLFTFPSGHIPGYLGLAQGPLPPISLPHSPYRLHLLYVNHHLFSPSPTSTSSSTLSLSYTIVTLISILTLTFSYTPHPLPCVPPPLASYHCFVISHPRETTSLFTFNVYLV